MRLLRAGGWVASALKRTRHGRSRAGRLHMHQRCEREVQGRTWRRRRRRKRTSHTYKPSLPSPSPWAPPPPCPQVYRKVALKLVKQGVKTQTTTPQAPAPAAGPHAGASGGGKVRAVGTRATEGEADTLLSGSPSSSCGKEGRGPGWVGGVRPGKESNPAACNPPLPCFLPFPVRHHLPLNPTCRRTRRAAAAQTAAPAQAATPAAAAAPPRPRPHLPRLRPSPCLSPPPTAVQSSRWARRSSRTMWASRRSPRTSSTTQHPQVV